MAQASAVTPSRALRARQARDRNWTVAAFLLAGLGAVQFAGQAILWFWPYHLAGLANELGLMVVAGAIAWLAIPTFDRRHALPRRRATLCFASLLYAAASMAGLGWSADDGLGLGVQRFVLFSTPGCEFTARFATPPELGRFNDATFEQERPSIATTANLAILADLKTFSSYRAECRMLDAANTALGTPVAMAAAAQWAQNIGVKISDQRSGRDERGDHFQIEGTLGGSILPETPGKPARTLVALRSYVGERSIMTLYVFQPQGEALSGETAAFLDGVRRR